MKKRFSAIILSLFFIFIYTFCSYAVIRSAGDINADGVVTASDARLALRASVNLENLSDAEFTAADTDKNGKVTASDARTILRAAVGLEKLESQEITAVTVNTPDEFLANIKSNTKITLGASLYTFSDTVSFSGIENLEIKGNAEIVLSDIKKSVFDIKNCKNITLDGLIIGHEEPSEYYFCEGQVITISQSSDISINNCQLYGCGSIGLDVNNSTDIKLKKTEIYDCTYSGISAYKSQIKLSECTVYGLILFETGAVIISDCSNLSFDNCNFFNNITDTFINNYSYQNEQSDIYFKHCAFDTNIFVDLSFSEEKLKFEDCIFIYNNGILNENADIFTDCKFSDNTCNTYLNYDNATIKIENISFTQDYVNGIEPVIKYTNNTNDQIAYIYIDINFYDRMGYPAYCTIKNTYSQQLKITGPIQGKTSYTAEWTAVIYNNAVGAIMPTKIDVIFTNGKTQTIYGDGTFWYTEDYYGGPLSE